jgi:malonyl-CoA/methylmalonyl-CoA synthetase
MVKSFCEELQHSFLANRDRTALVFAHRSYSFRDLEESAERAASLFQSRGVSPGDRVLIFLESKEPFLIAYLGTLWCGAIPLPLNPGFTPPELLYFIKDSGATTIVHDSASWPVVESVGDRGSPLVQCIAAAEILHAQVSAAFRPADPNPADPALILYSSGTTGEPKGVVHTQANLACAVAAIRDAWRFTPEDTLANVLPLFHIHGLSFATNVSLLAGSTMLVGDRFHPLQTLDLIDRATVFMGVPPYYYSLLKRDEFPVRATNWTRLRLLTCGSAPIRIEVLPQLQSILGRPVVNRYGMTECHVLTSIPLDGPWPHGSVGLPLRGVDVEVRTESGQACQAGEDGRVWARGPNLFREYWRQALATDQSFDHAGWFDTGDVGHLDERGFLTLVARSKDLIIVGGFNVYPMVVERVINECPGVRESAVVGVSDASRGERVAAFVVSDDRSLDARRVRDFCRERLADYQCPARVEIVAELPRNAMGKVLKRQLVR